jgi:hypothetical protein
MSSPLANEGTVQGSRDGAPAAQGGGESSAGCAYLPPSSGSRPTSQAPVVVFPSLSCAVARSSKQLLVSWFLVSLVVWCLVGSLNVSMNVRSVKVKCSNAVYH